MASQKPRQEAGLGSGFALGEGCDPRGVTGGAGAASLIQLHPAAPFNWTLLGPCLLQALPSSLCVAYCNDKDVTPCWEG